MVLGKKVNGRSNINRSVQRGRVRVSCQSSVKWIIGFGLSAQTKLLIRENRSVVFQRSVCLQKPLCVSDGMEIFQVSVRRNARRQEDEYVRRARQDVLKRCK